MTYAETIDYLYHVAPAFEKVGAEGYKEGLTTTRTLDAHFGHPHQHYKSIHIAGTNGKGSCAHTLAAILQAQGYRVGLYTSPHLVSFTERIRVNGVPIAQERVVAFVAHERAFFEPLKPSFFELTTALALLYFAEQHVDIAVIEVGMGGRLDCTNIIRPILSIITNISLDHTQFLGATLPLIAREKAGIIKAGVPCLIGEDHPATRPVFEQVAREEGAPLHFAQHHDDSAVAFQLKGSYQRANRDTILSAVALLREGLPISAAAVSDGCAHVCERTGLAGRWQTVRQQPLVICDTGHNLAAWQYLAPQLAALWAQKSDGSNALRIVFGMVNDKDVHGVLRLLPPSAQYYFCHADSHRAIPSAALAALAAAMGLRGQSYPSVAQAYAAAYSAAAEKDIIFVGGSSYVVGEMLATLQ